MSNLISKWNGMRFSISILEIVRSQWSNSLSIQFKGDNGSMCSHVCVHRIYCRSVIYLLCRGTIWVDPMNLKVDVSLWMNVFELIFSTKRVSIKWRPMSPFWMNWRWTTFDYIIDGVRQSQSKTFRQSILLNWER